MTTRAYMAFTLVLMVNAVMFGAGAITVLSVPALSDNAVYLLPAVIAISMIVSPLIAWAMAPTLRARWNRDRSRDPALARLRLDGSLAGHRRQDARF